MATPVANETFNDSIFPLLEFVIDLKAMKGGEELL